MLSGNCFKKNCKYIHTFFYCKGVLPFCKRDDCRRLHLLEYEVQNLNDEYKMGKICRPFIRNMCIQVDRLAKAIKGNNEKTCTRLLTGLNECSEKCNDCEMNNCPIRKLSFI